MRAFKIGTCITWIVILVGCMVGFCYFHIKGVFIGLNIAGFIISGVNCGLWTNDLCKILREKPNH